MRLLFPTDGDTTPPSRHVAIASIAGVARGTVPDWVSGRHRPLPAPANRLIDALQSHVTECEAVLAEMRAQVADMEARPHGHWLAPYRMQKRKRPPVPMDLP
jgi:hypothetical protein